MLLLFLVLLLPAVATSSTIEKRQRDSRLGTGYTSIPIYSTSSGSNIVRLGVGGSGTEFVTQLLDLSLSTSVNYLLVASTECSGCVQNAAQYEPTLSPTLSLSDLGLAYTYPATPLVSSTFLNITGELATETLIDARSDPIKRRIVLVDEFVDETGAQIGGNWGGRKGFPPDTSGFWGLGVDQATPNNSIISALADQTGFTVGLDISPPTSAEDGLSSIGTMHWGAVPDGTYSGSWNWITPVGSRGSVWAMTMNRFTVRGNDVSGNNLRVTIDPSTPYIAVPEQTAIALYSHIPSSTRDRQFPSRWTIPCNSSFSFSIYLPNGQYKINDTQLITSGARGGSCYGAIVAWEGRSGMDAAREVVMGTPFLLGVYTALHYAQGGGLSIGLAAKPGLGGVLVNPVGKRLSGGAIAGIIIALIIGLLVILGILSSRSRDSMAGYYSRMVRKQHKMAATQMQHQHPGFPAPDLIMAAQPVYGEPRHMDEIYSKPYIPGARQHERMAAIRMDPLNPLYAEQQMMQIQPRRGGGILGGWRRAVDERNARKEHERYGPHNLVEGHMVDPYQTGQAEMQMGMGMPYGPGMQQDPYAYQALGMPPGVSYAPKEELPREHRGHRHHHRSSDDRHHRSDSGSHHHHTHSGDGHAHREHRHHHRNHSHEVSFETPSGYERGHDTGEGHERDHYYHDDRQEGFFSRLRNFGRAA